MLGPWSNFLQGSQTSSEHHRPAVTGPGNKELGHASDGPRLGNWPKKRVNNANLRGFREDQHLYALPLCMYIYIYTNLHLYTYIANGYPPKKQSLLWMTGSSISGLYHCPRLFFWNWLLLYTPTNQASSIASVNHTFTLQQGKPNLPIGSSGMQIASASPLLFDPYQCQPQPKDPIETHGKSPWVWAKVLHSL